MRYFNLVKNIENWWGYLLFKFGIRKEDPLRFKTRRGILLKVPHSLLHAFKEIFMEECYMHGLRHTIPTHPIIIDIGANVGFFTLYAASCFPHARILSFEPIPSNFVLLEENISLNKNRCSISPYQKAVAGHSGQVMITLEDTDTFSTSSSIVRGDSKRGDDNGDLINVPCTTIQDIFDENEFRNCDFLKMDCEGAEYEIILNCPEEYLLKVKQFAIEVHQGPNPEYGTEYLKDYFHKRGFRTFETKKAFGMLWAWVPEGE